MKKIIAILITVICFGCTATKVKAQPPMVTSDTLQWLKTNIEQRNTYFVGKPLSVMLDSLYNLNGAIHDYLRDRVSDGQSRLTYPGDTVWTNNFILYLGKVFGGGAVAQMHEANWNVNTHIPYINITFTQQIPFPSSTYPGKVTFFGPVQGLCRPYIVQSFSVGEY